MRIVKFIWLALIFSACASHHEQYRSELTSLPEHKTLDIPFILQTDYHCGPASLAMISNNLGNNITPDELSRMMYTPESKGTFQVDLLSATRRLGFISVPVVGLKQMLSEVSAGHPILVFQNLGLSWFPKWHYAVVVGHDLEKDEIILHSGDEKNMHLDFSTFLKTWNRADNWAMLIVKPGTIPESASEMDLIKATAGLEAANHLELANDSYKKILEKWPQSLGALIGLGNISYRENHFEAALMYLKKATDFHPKAAGAWHNYAQLLKVMKKSNEARLAAQRAVANSDPTLTKTYAENLKDLL